MSDIRHFLFDNLLLQVPCGHQQPEHFHFVWLIWLFFAVRHCLFGKIDPAHNLLEMARSRISMVVLVLASIFVVCFIFVLN